MVPKNNSAATPYTINIAPGIYREHVFLGENRNFVTLRGTGPSRTSTQIVDIGVDGSFNAVVRLMSTDLRLQNLTMENTVGPVGPKMTLLTNSNRQVLENCLIKGWQDTLAAWSGAVYFKNCEVWGSVDFIYSGALAVFDSCDLVEIRETGGYFAAPSTPATQKYGLVFINSRFLRGQKRNGQPYDVKPGSTYLMRPWYPDGMTAVINCYTDDVVPTKGWAEWGGRENTCRAYEYGTKIIGGGTVTVADRITAGAYWVKTADPAEYTLTALLGAFAPVATGTTQDYNTLTGSAVTLNIPVSAASYQWYHNGAAIVGATGSSLALSNLQARDAGLYTLVATSAAGQVSTYTNTVNVLTAGGVAAPVQAVTGHLQQFSLRAVAGLGEDSMIIGFAVDSAGSRDMLLRAIGPGLSRFGLTGYLANPKLSVYRGATLIAQNDDWSTGLFAADIAAAANTTGAFSLATGSLDSAVYTRLSPNGYSAVVSSIDSSTGIVLLESYDATNTSVEARLSSISGRAKVGQGDEVLIIGFVVGGNAPAKVLVRAVGPGLTALGVKTALPDPKLELFSGGALLAQNDNWQNGVAGIETTMASLGLIAFGNGSKDAATYVTLEPGIYSAVVRSADTSSGVVLLQVLEVK